MEQIYHPLEFLIISNIDKDASGNIYIADADNRVIRKIDTNGNISTWAGNGNCCDDQVMCLEQN
jgi:hypothetical protein